MPAKPPPLPEAVYHRVMLVAKIDGYLVLIGAGMSAFLLAGVGLIVPAVAMCLAAGAGAMEVHGSQQLARGNATAVNWLVRAQLFLMLIILVFIVYLLTRLDASSISAQIPEFRRQMTELSRKWNSENPYDQFTDSQLASMMRTSFPMACYFVAIVTCIYSSLMARYYHKRRAAIAQALAAGA